MIPSVRRSVAYGWAAMGAVAGSVLTGLGAVLVMPEPTGPQVLPPLGPTPEEIAAALPPAASPGDVRDLSAEVAALREVLAATASEHGEALARLAALHERLAAALEDDWEGARPDESGAPDTVAAEEADETPEPEPVPAPVEPAPAAAVPARPRAPDPAPSVAAPPARPPAAAAPGLGVLINVNTAPQAELELLPRIGPEIARRIVEERAANGPFRRLEDLRRVRGIGPKTLDELRGHVRFE